MTLHPGDRLGAYVIDSVLKVGGWSVIYGASHARLRRKVALKVLNEEVTKQESSVRRFLREAKAVSEISHPNIVQIADLVELTDRDPPLYYMVTELLEGEDLGARLRKRKALDPDETIAIGEQIADALAAVHRASILHRDIKPENIFLVDDGGSRPLVKLLDFGLVKPLGVGPRTDGTAEGATIGTPDFMAPEQVLGRDADERTDVYGLGATLYCMLAGSAPFAHLEDLVDTLVAQTKTPPPPLAERRAGLPPVPPALEAVVMRCLEKFPTDRYQSAVEVRQALLASMRAGPTSRQAAITEEVDLPGRPVRGRSRSKRLAGLLVVIALGVGAAVTWTILQRRPGPPVRDAVTPGSGPDAARAPAGDRAAAPPDSAPPDSAPPAGEPDGPPAASAPTKPADRRKTVKRTPPRKVRKGSKTTGGKESDVPIESGTLDPFKR